MADLGTAFMGPVLQNQTYLQNEALAPVELAQKAAGARYTTAMADRLETETAGEKKVAEMMAQASGASPQMGGTGSISSRLMQFSDDYAKAGMVTKSAQLAAQAAQAQSHEATASAAKVREALQNFQLADKQFSMVTKLLGGVKDQDSWNEANRLFEEQSGQKSPLAGMPYDPKTVKLLQDASESAYQKQEIALKQTALQAHLADVGSKISSRATQDNIAGANLKLKEQRETRLAKAGGKDVGSPSKTEVEAVGRMLGDTGLEGDEKDSAAFLIAAEAKVLRRKNPGISADEAMRQSMMAAKQRGDIVPGEKSSIPFLGKDGPAKFVTPQALPSSRDPKDLVVGAHYKNKAGVVKVWDGKAFKDVGKSAPAASSSSDDEEDDDE